VLGSEYAITSTFKFSQDQISKLSQLEKDELSKYITKRSETDGPIVSYHPSIYGNNKTTLGIKLESTPWLDKDV
jgi:hypothetical protein